MNTDDEILEGMEPIEPILAKDFTPGDDEWELEEAKARTFIEKSKHVNHGVWSDDEISGLCRAAALYALYQKRITFNPEAMFKKAREMERKAMTYLGKANERAECAERRADIQSKRIQTLKEIVVKAVRLL